MSKDSRIHLRISTEEKIQLEKKVKKLDMIISEYFRQLYIHGEVLIVLEQVSKDIREIAINVNQLARRLNGDSTTRDQVIIKLTDIVNSLKKMYIR